MCRILYTSTTSSAVTALKQPLETGSCTPLAVARHTVTEMRFQRALQYPNYWFELSLVVRECTRWHLRV